MIPASFTTEQIKEARDFILSHIHENSRIVKTKIQGNPFITYKELADHFGFVFDACGDDHRIGVLAGTVSEYEFSHFNLLLSAVVVNSERLNPGKGFYDLAKGMKMFNSEDAINPNGFQELQFWNDHVFKIVDCYGHK